MRVAYFAKWLPNARPIDGGGGDQSKCDVPDMMKYLNYDYGFDVSHRIFVPIEVEPWTFGPLPKFVP